MSNFIDLSIFQASNSLNDRKSTNERANHQAFERLLEQTRIQSAAQQQRQHDEVKSNTTAAKPKQDKLSAEQFRRIYTKIYTPPSYMLYKKVVTKSASGPEPKQKSAPDQTYTALPFKSKSATASQEPKAYSLDQTHHDSERENSPDDAQPTSDSHKKSALKQQDPPQEKEKEKEKAKDKIKDKGKEKSKEQTNLASSSAVFVLNQPSLAFNNIAQPENQPSDQHNTQSRRRHHPFSTQANLDPVLDHEDEQGNHASDQSDQQAQQAFIEYSEEALLPLLAKEETDNKENKSPAEEFAFTAIDMIDLQEQAHSATQLFAENGPFGRIVRSIAGFCMDLTIQTLGSIKIEIPIDQKVLAETTLTMSLSPNELQLHFETGNPSSYQLLEKHTDKLKIVLEMVLQENSCSRTVNIFF